MRHYLTLVLLASCLFTGAAAVWGQPYAPNDRTLLLDHLDEDFAPDGVRCTKPAIIKSAGDFTGGRPGKGGEFVPGKFGKALQFHKLMQMQYPATGNLDLSAGVVEFWVALDFNAAEVLKNPGVLSNQLFFTVWGSGRSQACVYSTLGYTCVCVYDQERQIVCYGNFEGAWKKGEWHHLELKWGRQLELWCHGERRIANEWNGLFGPVDVKPEDLRITLGSHIGWSTVESEFAVDELRILGPGGDQVPDYPAMTVPRIKPPAIDGEVGEAEWAGAARTTGFVALNERALVEDQTVVYAGWDNEALYVAFECLDPKQRPLIAAFKDRDANVWLEDAVDVFLQPKPTPAPYYQLITSAIGTVYDSRLTEKVGIPQAGLDFNPNWLVRTTKAPGRWTMEARIPFKELDGQPTPKEGERWRVNFCRDADAASRLSSWAYVAGNFHRTAAFGELVFSDSDRAIRVGPLGDWAMGKVETLVAMTGLSFDPLVTVRGKVVGSDAKTLVATENRLADYKAVTVKAPPLVTGLYSLTLRADSQAGCLCYQRLPFRVMKPYDITAEGYPYEGKLWVTAIVAGLGEAQKGVVARSRLMQGDKTFGACETREFAQGRGAAALDITDLAPGKYVVKSEAVAPDGKVMASAEAEFEQFAKPPWWRSKAGLDHSIPWPWEPVRATGKGIKVWGREYQCGEASLPKQIVNQGEEVLAAPISLKLTAGGQTTDLANLRAVDAATTSDVSYRQAATRVGQLDVKLAVVTEFDGMQCYDLTLTPSVPTEVTGLTLEIPIKTRYATFMLSSNGSSGSARVVGKEPWRSPFMPQVWVGNDDLGFAWFAESDQYWTPRDEEMLEVAPEATRTVVRCKIVRQPLKIEKPVTLTFGIVATPVKDAHAGDPFWVRFTGLLGEPTAFDDPMHSGQPVEFLRYPGKGNLDPKQGTLEFWLAPTIEAGGAQREVVSIAGAAGGLSLSFDQGGQTMTLSVPWDAMYLVAKATAVETKLNEYVHVALTWGGRVEFFVGGERRATVHHAPFAAALASVSGGDATPVADYQIRFGCAADWQGYTRIAVDEVRVSKAVRYTGDRIAVPGAAFTPDADTLLLDHLDDKFKPDGEDSETRPSVISGQSGELGGTPTIGCKFVDGRFGAGLQVAIPEYLSSAEANRRWGGNAWCYWDWFERLDQPVHGWPAPLFVEPPRGDLRPPLKRMEEAGIRVCPYMAYTGLGAPSQLSKQFGAEWSRQPLSTQPAEPPKGHYFLDCCGRSGFGDYLAAGTQWLLEDLGFYGCYTDGNAHVYPCKNTHHGCGYYDEKGVLRATWPVFPTREYLKRIYKIIHAKHQDGYLVNHVSFDTFIPTQSFTDVYYTGEHEQYEDLTKFRVRWQGKQWGYWPILLGGDAHIYEPMYMTYGLLHGVSVWPQGALGRNDCERKTVNLWQTYDRFDYRKAEWIPYYRAEKSLAKADNKEVKVSLYLHKGKRALLIVGNLAHEVVNCKVNVNVKAMGLKGTSARNALDERGVLLQNGVLSVRLRPVSFVLVELQ